MLKIKKRNLLIALLCLILNACSSDQKKQRAHFYTQLNSRMPANIKCEESSCIWATQYRDALANFKNKKFNQACDSFVQLSELPSFSLKSLSAARAFSACSLENKSAAAKRLPSIETFLGLSFPAWMGDTPIRSALIRSQTTRDEFAEYKISVQILNEQMRRRTASQSDNEKLANRAIDIFRDHSADEAYRKVANLEQLHEKQYEIAPRLIPNLLILKSPKETFCEAASRLHPTPQRREKLWLAAKDFERSKLDFKNARLLFNQLFEINQCQATKASDELEAQFRALDAIRYTFKLERSSDHASLFEAAKKTTDFSHKNLKQRGKESLWSANYVKASLLYAGHLWTFTKTDGSTKLAIKVLEDAIANLKIIKSEYSIDDLVLMRARIADEQGDTDLALKLLQNIGKDTKDEDRRDQMLWTKAFIFYKLQRFAEAAQAFTEMIPNDPKEHNSRAHFWRAESLKQLHSTNTGSSSPTKILNPSLIDFNWLIENEPFGYYGLVAAHELKLALPSIESVRKAQHDKRKSDEKSPSSISPFDSAELFETSQLLISVKEIEFERKLLDQTVQKMKATRSTTTQNWIDLLKNYAQAEQYQNLFESLASMPLEIRSQVFADNPELVFPTEPFTELVQSTAKKLQVPWEFVFSIMRQESSLNPMARSPANAFGLLQLIPENALAVAKDVDIRLESYKDSNERLQLANPEVLFDPAINVPLGIALMKRLFKKNQNNFIKTVASYNASPSAVDGWIRSRYRGDILAFIDDIPYEETKTYIKTVMRNYIYYSRLENPTKDFEFPAWCLEDFPLVNQ